MMSSATSIEPEAPVAAGSDQGPRKPDAAPRDAFRPWHFFLLMSLVAATVAVVLARQSRPEHLVLISLTIGAAGFAAGALYRTLAPLVSDEALPADLPPSGGLRDSLEREKALVLRSIKELEFDRAMGKVSSKDFDEMAGRLRARAMSLMRQLDAGSAYRELIERELAARIRRPPAASPAGRVLRKEAVAMAAVRSESCACGTVNDSDAAFCKRCGTKLTRVAS